MEFHATPLKVATPFTEAASVFCTEINNNEKARQHNRKVLEK
jgi:hypothetical protein